ncbi:MAG: GNAT family N-acetyltransferase [Clostridiales Family XIII bacterium]|jgi:GNAT superfamily N-acetyltransferase|nr:GNAT family N-acetyltransferase [Clostridiales Family XIII bacterium]
MPKTAHDIRVRKARSDDLEGLLGLYGFLNNVEVPSASDPRIVDVWNKILNNRSQHVLIGTVNEVPASTCVLIIVENLTRNGRSHAIIENVVTHPSFRKNGIGTLVLNEAKRIAEEYNCYKIMLMTGSKDPNVWSFYEHAGYNTNDKRAYLMWVGDPVTHGVE